MKRTVFPVVALALFLLSIPAGINAEGEDAERVKTATGHANACVKELNKEIKRTTGQDNTYSPIEGGKDALLELITVINNKNYLNFLRHCMAKSLYDSITSPNPCPGVESPLAKDLCEEKCSKQPYCKFTATMAPCEETCGPHNADAYLDVQKITPEGSSSDFNCPFAEKLALKGVGTCERQCTFANKISCTTKNMKNEDWFSYNDIYIKYNRDLIGNVNDKTITSNILWDYKKENFEFSISKYAEFRFAKGSPEFHVSIMDWDFKWFLSPNDDKLADARFPNFEQQCAVRGEGSSEASNQAHPRNLASADGTCTLECFNTVVTGSGKCENDCAECNKEGRCLVCSPGNVLFADNKGRSENKEVSRCFPKAEKGGEARKKWIRIKDSSCTNSIHEPWLNTGGFNSYPKLQICGAYPEDTHARFEWLYDMKTKIINIGNTTNTNSCAIEGVVIENKENSDDKYNTFAPDSNLVDFGPCLSKEGQDENTDWGGQTVIFREAGSNRQCSITFGCFSEAE
eukprot:Nk52_evm23s559 gene=Nk52_evmTU23s559